MQAAGSWNKTTCCADRTNYCPGSYCVQKTRTASDGFIFRLSPGAPERVLRIAGGNLFYQYARPDRWPAWGSGADLQIGWGGPPGTHGHCNQGGTYLGGPNGVCGGYNNWGPGANGGAGANAEGRTDIEVWYPVESQTGH